MTPAIRALPPDQRIDWAIHELAGKNPDGTYDYTDVSVRVARAMAKAGHTATQTALRDLRAGTAPPRRWNPLSHSLEVERPAMTEAGWVQGLIGALATMRGTVMAGRSTSRD
jgi:hypothetical protein